MIFDEIAQYLSSDWEKLVVYLEYDESSYLISFYEKTNGQFVNCNDIPQVSEDSLADSFSKIDAEMSKARMAENETWTNMTMIVFSTGEMHTVFDYTDLSTGSYKYKKEWKSKYLKSEQ